MLGHRDTALALFHKAVDERIERKLAEMRSAWTSAPSQSSRRQRGTDP